MTDQTSRCAMPCGRCDAGTYAPGVLLDGIERFRECATKRDALRAAPRCKADGSHICFGARDFIRAASFPLDTVALEALVHV